MPWPDPELVKRAEVIPRLLRAIEAAAEGEGFTTPGSRMQQLASVMRESHGPVALRRTWNRWLAGTAVSDGARLTNVVAAADRCKWIKPQEMPREVRALMHYLLSHEAKRRHSAVQRSVQGIRRFAEGLFKDRVLSPDDAVWAAKELLGAVVDVVAQKARASKSIRFEDAEEAAEEAADAVRAPMRELAAYLYESEAESRQQLQLATSSPEPHQPWTAEELAALDLSTYEPPRKLPFGHGLLFAPRTKRSQKR